MYDANEVMNGLYGYCYDENGQQLQSTQSFEAIVEFAKEPVKQAGKFLESHKVMGGSGSGTLMIHKLDSRLQKKIADNPTAKYNYIGKLAQCQYIQPQYQLFIFAERKGRDFTKNSFSFRQNML